MFRIEEKDYDLNFLFRYDMLREILIKLLKNQNNLQNEIDLLNISNKDRDNKIVNIEKTITELQEELNRDETEFEHNDVIELENNKENQIQQKKKEENDDKESNINENNIGNEEKIDKAKEKEELTENKTNNTIKLKENNEEKPTEQKEQKEEEKEINKKEEKEINQKEKSENENIENKKEIFINKEEKEKLLLDKSNNKSIELSEKEQNNSHEKRKSTNKRKSIPKDQNQIPINVKELISRMNLLEIKLNNIYINKDYKNIKQELKNHDLENQSDFKVIDMKLNDFNKILDEYKKKIEDCELKCASFDILNIIKDNGNGNIDGAKILFKSLEDKCSKKFEIIDARYKQEVLGMEKLKKNVDNILPMFDKIGRDMKHIKELEEQQKEEIENTKKNLEVQNENNIKLQKESDDELTKKLNDLKNGLDKKYKELDEKLKSIKKVEGEPLFNYHLDDDKDNEEKFQILEKKINDIRTKMNDLNNTLRIFATEETLKIKNDVKELMYKMDSKIAKEDLKELYNMHLSDLDEINDLKDQISLISEEHKKTTKDIQQVGSRLESINSNVILLQNSQLNGGRGPIIDITRFIDQQKLSDTLKPMIREIEKLYREISGLHREFDEIKNYDKIFEKKERINRMEEEIFNKIKENDNLNNRKFADKIDTNKALKALDLLIKDISGERKRSEGSDNWLMAKQPLKCFNCASCEANLRGGGSTQEYIPWNKYPQGERIYRMGQGFSHMLQMMTSEFVQTFEHNDKDSKESNINLSVENDSNMNSKSLNKIYNSINNNTNNNNNINNYFSNNEKSLISSRLNNKDEFYRTGGKLKLPKMKKFSKYIKEKFDDTIPVTDEEKENNGNSSEKGNLNIESPKIMKIIKKKGKNAFNMSGYSPNYGFSMDYGRSKHNKDKFDLNMKDKILKKNHN